MFNAGTITGTAGTAIEFFTGGTNTLTLGPGFVVNGNVVSPGGDTFQLGGASGNGTFDLSTIGTQYQGFTTFNVVGGATWTATGTYAQTDAWDVQGGTLLVNGDLSNATTVTAESGAALGGAGTLGVTIVNNGGSLIPGAVGSPGTLTINGSLSMGASANYVVFVNPTTFARTDVNGTASLGGTVFVNAAPGSYTPGKYTVLAATGGLGGTTFSGLNTLGFGGSVKNPHLEYDTDDVFLVLDQGTLALLQGFTVNQTNVANGINNAINNGAPVPAGFNALLNLSGSQLTSALNQISGEAAGGIVLSGNQLTSEFLTLMLGSPGSAPAGGVLGFARAAPPLKPEAALAYAAVTPKDKRPATFDSRWGLWAAGFGGYNKTDGDAVIGSTDTTAKTYGVAAGANYIAAPDLTLGFALAGGGTSWSLDSGFGSGRSDAFLAGAYAMQKFGAAYLSGAISSAWHSVTTDRTVTIAGTDKLHADFNAHDLGGRIEAGYRFATMPIAVTPYAAFQAQNFWTPAYNEMATSGAGTFALSYDSRSVTATRVELGSWFDRLFVLDGGNELAVRARAAWVNNHNGNKGIDAVFQTLPGSNFTVFGATAPENAALATAAAELRLASKVTLSVKFDGELASGAQTYAGTGELRYEW